MIYLVQDGGDILRRRALVSATTFLEAWPDLQAGGVAWITEAARTLLDGVGEPLRVLLALDAGAVPIYYGRRLTDLDALPAEDSLRARVLSAHGIAVALVTLDQFGEPVFHQPSGPEDPVFVLRRPRGTVAHRWRLFRARDEAVVFMREFYGHDAEAQAWAGALGTNDWTDLMRRLGPAGGSREG